eukprot:TRINITY_DN51492_c0_g1_i1.p1 TRINITY_DN51492_c0_g1~~TRINITY_DN51492_c0_g1_i1.p1  ORF type:complete len:313 (-),score=28.11 TRINITY_DN51492_c0_g1_i1:215-1153(-)
MNSVVEYVRENWDVESYPKFSDLSYGLIVALFFPTIRYVLDRFVFEKLGKKFIVSRIVTPAGSTKAKINDVDKDALFKTHIKFKESCWKCAYYLSAEIFSLIVTIDEPWFKETKYFWIGPGLQKWPDQMMKFKLKLLYAYVGGFYAYSIFALIFWETRRKDFGVSMTHHVSSVLLIAISYIFRFGRLCSVMVAVHDASDVFLELAKLSKYVNLETCATVNFLIFAASWAWLRLWWYPRNIIYSSSYEVLHLVVVKELILKGPYIYYMFNFMLILLFVLHVYWWVLIARVIQKQLWTAGTVEGDVRSDDEDDD